MVKSFSEFMASRPIEHYPVGRHDTAQQTEAALPRFCRRNNNSDASPERMERLKKLLSESKTGRQTLEFLEQKGSEMVFERMDYYGYFSPDENKVALNPSMSDADLAVTFVHEVRHAWQDSKMETTTPDMTPKSFLVSGFLIEADACAAEVTFANEMRTKHPEIWNAHQRSPYAPMSTAFDKELKSTGNETKARAAALKTWYDLPLRQDYEGDYVDYLVEVAQDASKKKSDKIFFENRSTENMTETLCKDYDGKQFFNDAKELETPEKLSLSEGHARKLTRSLGTYMLTHGVTSKNLGLDLITVDRKKGTPTTCADMLEKVNDSISRKQTAKMNAVRRFGASR